MHLRILIFLVVLLAGIQNAVSQVSNLKQKKIATKKVQVIDSLSIIPATVIISNYDSSYYRINYIKSTIVWLKPVNEDSVFITYRSFPFSFNRQVYRYNYDSIVNRFAFTPVPIAKKQVTDNEIFNFGSLTYNGSLGRSLSFGNNQDAVFTSQLNLQLNGYIGDSIELTAAITDNNIPIQPEGTTHQLNEFDRILLQFKKPNWQLDLGDIDLRQNQQYFLNFYKRLQGAAFSQKWKAGKNISNETSISGAVAKGKFARNIFQGQEGNQGPYRLQGVNNEFFFIVLAGTERVFIDGEFMQRGEDQDYVINYNTAEITFTPKRMITKDKRIQVEFEYADRNYLNSMLYVKQQTKIGKQLTLILGAYSNADAKNSPINQTLNNEQKQFLADIGDSIQKAYYPSFGIDSFSATKILYKRIDTLHNGTHDSIFVYSTSKDSAKYSLNFLYVGDFKGNYQPLFNGANGKVYQWVAPINGIPQGSFEPAVFLVTPKQQQVFSASADYVVNAKTSIKTDLGLSNYNLNKFSSKDKKDDVGYAGKISITHNTPVLTSGKKLNLTAIAGYEWVNQHFRPVERLRAVEFGRDWGLNYNPTPADEHLPNFSLQLKDAKQNQVSYDFTGYLRSDNYKGYRHVLQHRQTWNNWTLNNVLNVTFINTPYDKGYFLRPLIELSRQIPSLKNIAIGGSYALEENKIKNRITDTVTSLSFSFETISAFIRSDQSRQNKWAFTYFTRRDKYPYDKSLLESDRSHNYAVQATLLANPKHQVNINATYRELHVTRQIISNQKAENSLLGRIEYLINEWKGFINGSMLYELGAGQEPRRDFSYFEVPAGRGEYAWNDYNGDGIPQLNEFEIALFPDQAKYIRIFTPTSQFIKANYTQFNYNITVNPKALFTVNAFSKQPFLSRFLLQSSLQTGKKAISDKAATFNPFKGEVQDTALIQLNSVFSNTISYNRFSSKWGIDVTNVRNFGKSLLTYGLETRERNDWIVRSRINFGGAYTLELIQRFTTNNLYTPAFENRNFAIRSIQLEPRISYTYQTKFRFLAGYQIINKQNAVMYGGEKSVSNVFNLETKYNLIQNTSINVKLSFNNIQYTGKTNTTVSYILLDGLLPGKNTLWTVDLTKRLLNNLELNFQYEGRKPSETNTIHIGRASIRAIL